MESGIVAIRNLKTDRCYLFYADNIQEENTKQRFALDLGMHECASLQKDYTETGLEVFRFETVLLTDDSKKISEMTEIFPLRYN